LAALNALGRFNRQEVSGDLLAHWASFSPRLRSEALTVLLARPERAAALLQEIEHKVIRPSELSSTKRNFCAPIAIPSCASRRSSFWPLREQRP